MRASRFLLALAFLGLSVERASAGPVQHYLFVNVDRARIHDPAFLRDPSFAGAQIKYTWRGLEPEKDRYDFSEIREDLAVLSEHGKRLFIQLQDVSFQESIVNVPQYLRDDPAYRGGAHLAVLDKTKGTRGGWVPRRWDPLVRRRFHELLGELGREFDGKIEGINLAETAIDIGEPFPEGYSHTAYRDGILENMTALKKAFPRSVAMIYANFMPGEWLPGEDRGYLRSVYAHARKSGVAVGAPDLLPYRKGQINHAYKLMPELAEAVPRGIAIQEGNYSHTNPATGDRVKMSELLAFARDRLKVNYMFWFPEEPFFSSEVLPALRRESTSRAQTPRIE
jgi:hypothetical protein